MDIQSFREQLVASEPALAAWGAMVVKAIGSLANSRGITPQILQHRVKDIDSAIGKLTRKTYDSPMLQMTDLVGARAVCLLSPDVTSLVNAVLAHDGWQALTARDTTEEAIAKPETFGYQSLHCELRVKDDIQDGQTLIPAGTCCELQVRTLMQHAYAEVVHDNIYKNSWETSPKALRFVSNSAALIEAADHLFCETMNILETESRERGELLEQLTGIYDSRVSHTAGKDQKFNMMVLREFKDFDGEKVIAGVNDILDKRTTIASKIRERLPYDPFWGQPVSLFAYFLVSEDPDLARELWPFAESEGALAQVFSDLGQAYYLH